MATEPRELRAFAPALALLTVVAVISYIDRTNLSIAAPLLQSELHISVSQIGILLSGFFWSYTALQFICGWIVDRFDASRAIAAGFLLWSLATAATGLVQGFALLFAMRILLGVGESVTFPAFSKILSLLLPEHNRGFANGLLQGAIRLAPALGALVTGSLMARYGWRPAFIGVGLVSLLWLPAWKRWMPRGRNVNGPPSASPDYAEIVRQRSFWGDSAGHFTNLYLHYFMLTLLPLYLVREHHLSFQWMTRIASGYYALDGLTAIAIGWIADSFIRAGHTPTVIRKSAMAIGHLLAALGAIGCAFATSQWYLLCLAAIGIGSGAAGSGNWAISQTVAGPQASGKWAGLKNGVANLSGVIAPALTGFLVQRTGTFLVPLAISSTVMLAGGLSWVFVVGRVEQVRWKMAPASAPAAAASILR